MQRFCPKGQGTSLLPSPCTTRGEEGVWGGTFHGWRGGKPKVSSRLKPLKFQTSRFFSKAAKEKEQLKFCEGIRTGNFNQRVGAGDRCRVLFWKVPNHNEAIRNRLNCAAFQTWYLVYGCNAWKLVMLGIVRVITISEIIVFRMWGADDETAVDLFQGQRGLVLHFWHAFHPRVILHDLNCSLPRITNWALLSWVPLGVLLDDSGVMTRHVSQIMSVMNSLFHRRSAWQSSARGFVANQALCFGFIWPKRLSS